MNLDEKIAQANGIILAALVMPKKPALCISFGKDSMVMLDLVQRLGYTFPVVYWRLEHSFPKKHQFANRMIEKHDLEVYDYPPSRMGVIKVGDRIDVVNQFMLAKGKLISIPSGIYTPKDGEKHLCGYRDMYKKPTGGMWVPWDCFLIGHKNCDVDPMQGAIPLREDVVRIDDALTLGFPLRHFTDEDIWEYSERFGVEQDMKRYGGGEDAMEYNNDHYPACTDCLVEHADELNWIESIRPAYFGDK